MAKKPILAPVESNLLTTEQAHAYMGGVYSVSFLQQLRCNKSPDGPKFIKFGKYVRYRKEDLDEYIESKLVDPKLFRKNYDDR